MRCRRVHFSRTKRVGYCWIGPRQFLPSQRSANARVSIATEILALGPAASPQRRSSNANGLRGQNSAGFPQIYATFQRDSLRRHF
jgi:hypothetical protein